MAERVEAGSVGFLIDAMWPEDAYGVIAAKDKAGKTWVAVDLAVSVATGGRWLSNFDCAAGPVLMYCGEGGARNIVRRVRAVAEHKNISFGELHHKLHVSEDPPQLKDPVHIKQLIDELKLFRPKLVIIDPLYLAAAGGRGSDLYAMGEVLRGVQRACQEYGAALLVTHHWNKTGTGTGIDRITGVGPTAWGRVLGSGSVERVTREGARETVEVEWEFVGSEIAGKSFTMTRTVWVEDQHDLLSPMHYEVSVYDGLARTLHHTARKAEEHERLVAWLTEHPNSSTSAVERALGRAARDRLFTLGQTGDIYYVTRPRNSRLWSVTS